MDNKKNVLNQDGEESKKEVIEQEIIVPEETPEEIKEEIIVPDETPEEDTDETPDEDTDETPDEDTDDDIEEEVAPRTIQSLSKSEFRLFQRTGLMPK